ncbi:hypothetical protein [Cellvibrio sp. OA-2007]|uniref:hypothetical protein n=2 Tax=Cellvibrio TaxID=10 RepID=UPI0012455D81|nr:hypothetical protein [Cellvibrio sp. OA-2007]
MRDNNMKNNRLFLAFTIGSVFIYSMMLLIGVQPGDSVLYSSPAFTHDSPLSEAEKTTARDDDGKLDNNVISTSVYNHKPELIFAPTEITTPSKNMESTETYKIKSDFFDRKINNIGRDEQGNYVVTIATDSKEESLIQSTSPIYYPTETDLNYGVKGCVLGGYYIELSHHIVLITKSNAKQTQHVYRCDYNSETNTYILSDL